MQTQWLRRDPLVLTGTSELTISLQEGKQFGQETTRRAFEGSTWLVRSDGTFEFHPSPINEYAPGLFPIRGTYTTLADGRYALRGISMDKSGHIAALEGTIQLLADSAKLDIVQKIISHPPSHRKVARVTQLLMAGPASEEPTLAFGEIAVPSIFDISLMGNVDELAFGPLAAQLTIELPYLGDPNPVRVSLSSEDVSLPGSILLQSRTPRANGGGDLNCKVGVDGNRIEAELVDATGRAGPGRTYFTRSSAYAPDLTTGVQMLDGTLSFAVTGGTINGTFQARGMTDLDNVLGQIEQAGIQSDVDIVSGMPGDGINSIMEALQKRREQYLSELRHGVSVYVARFSGSRRGPLAAVHRR